MEDVVRAVMQRVDALVDRRLREQTESLVRLQVMEQVQILRPGLQEELESLVRQAVTETMGVQASQPDIEINTN